MRRTLTEKLSRQRVESILNSAMLAPSSHNTQPWRFRVFDNHIFLYADRTRALPENDPQDRELTMSCGCALMNLRIAIAHEGFKATHVLLPEPKDKDLLAKLELDKSKVPANTETELFPFIKQRRSYRKRFTQKQVASQILRELALIAADEGAWFQVIEADDVRHQVAALVAEGDRIQWSNSAWRGELAAWLHSGRKGDGLVVPGLVIPFAKIFIRNFDIGKSIAAKDKQHACEAPVLAVLGTEGDGELDWLNAGQALEKILLKACANGLQASFLNQPIQLSSLRIQLQNLLGRAGFPQLLFSLGFPLDSLAPTPRRDLVEVLKT